MPARPERRLMLVGRRYRLELRREQAAYAERVAAICRSLWNAALEQRRAAAEVNRFRAEARQKRPTYVTQCRELAEAKRAEAWLSEAPSHCLPQTIRDLDRACSRHGVWRVRWRSKRRSHVSFRFPDPAQIGTPVRLTRRWGEVKLPKFGAVRFRWSRPPEGTIHNATVLRDGEHWCISFCVQDDHADAEPNGLPPVGIDRGVIVPVACSDGNCFHGAGMRPREHCRLRRLQRRLARQQKASNRRLRTVRAFRRVFGRIRHRRIDVAHQTAHSLTTEHGMGVLEALGVRAMTASAKATLEHPGTHVHQKAGLNRAILDKAWSQFRTVLAWHGRKNGRSVVAVPAAHTSQTCSSCGHCAAESRESQSKFRCIACGHRLMPT